MGSISGMLQRDYKSSYGKLTIIHGHQSEQREDYQEDYIALGRGVQGLQSTGNFFH